MSNKFKAIIRERYKGRGNCWVKVPSDHEVYNIITSSLEDKEASEYTRHIEREGYAWIRFSKPSGNENLPKCLFELRYKGSKIDHPDCIIDIEDKIAETLPLLGNTPVKLQLEVDPCDRKEKKKKEEKPKRRRKNKDLLQSNSLNNEIQEESIEVIKEAVLTKATLSELKEWELFLKAEGLLDFAI